MGIVIRHIIERRDVATCKSLTHNRSVSMPHATTLH